MTMSDEDPALRRILVALDVSEQSRAALESAARLAAGLQAELVGLFVEDSELLQVAELPVTRLIGPQGPARLDAALLRRAFRVQAAEARQTLERTAEQWHVKWSFQVTRGAAAEAVVAEARQFDLVALGRTSRPAARTAPLGATARQAALSASCSVLVSRGGQRPGCPLLALYEGTNRLLPIAADLSRVYACGLIVKVAARDPESAAELEAEARGWLQKHGIPGRIERATGTDPQALRDIVRESNAGLLVLDPRGPLTAQLDLESLLEQQEVPVLLLR